MPGGCVLSLLDRGAPPGPCLWIFSFPESTRGEKVIAPEEGSLLPPHCGQSRKALGGGGGRISRPWGTEVFPPTRRQSHRTSGPAWGAGPSGSLWFRPWSVGGWGSTQTPTRARPCSRGGSPPAQLPTYADSYSGCCSDGADGPASRGSRGPRSRGARHCPRTRLPGWRPLTISPPADQGLAGPRTALGGGAWRRALCRREIGGPGSLPGVQS